MKLLRFFRNLWLDIVGEITSDDAKKFAKEIGVQIAIMGSIFLIIPFLGWVTKLFGVIKYFCLGKEENYFTAGSVFAVTLFIGLILYCSVVYCIWPKLKEIWNKS